MTTPDNPFVSGDSSEFFSPQKNQQWMGQLIVIRPNRVKWHDFGEGKGPQEQVEAWVLFPRLGDPTGAQRPWIIGNATIGQAGLVPMIKNKLGQMVLGHLRQKPPQGAKSGAYYIDDYTAEDLEYAKSVIGNPAFAPPAYVEVPAEPTPQPAAPQLPGGQGQVAYGQPPVPGAGYPAAQQYAAAQPAAYAGQGVAQQPYDAWSAVPGAQPVQQQPAQQAPSAWAPQQQPQAPVQQPPAQGWAPQAAPAPAAAQPAAQGWGQPAPAVQSSTQDQALVQRLLANNINPAGMPNEQMQMIANMLP